MTIENPEDMHNILLRQNFGDLLKSNESIFNSKKFQENIGWEAEKDLVDKILQGINDEKVLEDLASGNHLTQNFITAMQLPTQKDGSRVKPFKWNYGIQEYKLTFSKTREQTACGPSGLHMSHWKAALERECLMRVHSFFIWAAFGLGFSYKRWEKSWHCMLKKKDEPYSQKLRIIQLFEGDFNGGLKYLLGRQLIKHATKTGIIDNEAYGSRTGKTANEAILNLQLLYDNHRIWKKNLGLLFNDADKCFDRITINLADIALRRMGCSKTITKCNTIVLRNMKHHIKTSHGISKGYIQFNEETKKIYDNKNNIIKLSGRIGGVGQGGGGSPIIWLGVLLILLEAYRKTNKGANMEHRRTAEQLIYWILSYVDDNSIVQTFDHDTSVTAMLEAMKKSLLEWNHLLEITGGGLSLEKCKITLMKWKSNYWGIQTLSAKANKTETIQINKDDSLERLEPWNAERILGVRLPMNGDMRHEFNFRKDQATSLGKKLYQAPFTPHDANMVYETRYKPMITYALSITTFSELQLNEIQKKFIYLLLPKLGLNRNTPRAVIYGPACRGGRSILDLRLEQPSKHYKTNMGHIRRGDQAGSALLTTLHDTQLESGMENPFYTYSQESLEYLTKNTRWGYMWSFCERYNLDMTVWGMWTPSTRIPNDKVIMTTAINDPKYEKKEKWKLEVINTCRMYLGIIYISEMTNNEGRIPLSYLNGDIRIPQQTTKYNYPPVRKTPKSAWSEWKSFICRNYTRGPYEVTPKLENQIDEATTQDNHSINEMVILNTLPSENSMTALLSKLPGVLRDILGEITIPNDDGSFLWEEMRLNKLVGASDGSIQRRNGKKMGGHSYSLQSYSTNENRITGYSATPRSTEISSLTAEMYGIIATLIAIKLLEHKHWTTGANSAKIIIYTDNMETVKRSMERPTVVNITDTLIPEFDLWKLIWDIKSTIKQKVLVKWVKGHQDEDKNGNNIHGPFQRDIQLNIDMDEKAKLGVSLHQGKLLKRPVYSQTLLALYTNEGEQIIDLYSYLQKTENGKQLETYIKKKFQWTDAHIQTIHWDALEQALKTTTAFQR